MQADDALYASEDEIAEACTAAATLLCRKEDEGGYSLSYRQGMMPPYSTVEFSSLAEMMAYLADNHPDTNWQPIEFEK